MISEDKLYQQVGILVRLARENRGLSQLDLAQRIGLQRTSVTNIEAGKQKIQLHTLFNVAHALGISPESLLPLDDIVDTEMIDKQLQEQNIDSEEQMWIKRVLSSDDHGT